MVCPSSVHHKNGRIPRGFSQRSQRGSVNFPFTLDSPCFVDAGPQRNIIFCSSEREPGVAVGVSHSTTNVEDKGSEHSLLLYQLGDRALPLFVINTRTASVPVCTTYMSEQFHQRVQMNKPKIYQLFLRAYSPSEGLAHLASPGFGILIQATLGFT